MNSSKKTSQKKGQRGFTFIEVLTVIIILAILIGASLPAYLYTRDDARKRKMDTAIQRVIEAKTKFYNAERTAAASVPEPSLAQVAEYLMLDPTEAQGRSGPASTNSFFSNHPDTIFADCFPKNEVWMLKPNARNVRPEFVQIP